MGPPLKGWLDFETAHPETDEPLYVEAVYRPEEPKTRDNPGYPAQVEIIAVVNHKGQPVSWQSVEKWLEDRAMQIAGARAEDAKLERYLANS